MLFSCIYLPYVDSDTPGQKRTAKMGAGGAPKRKKKKGYEAKLAMVFLENWRNYY